MANPTVAHRPIRSWRIAALVAVAACGCSGGGVERRIDGVRVEPEVIPATRRAVGPVPVVIAPARPFRAAGGVPHRHGEPGRLAAVTDGRPADARGEITAALAEYLRDFNRHDTAAVVAHWSEQGENVDLDSGEATVGRDAVHGVFATLFAQDAGAEIDIDVQSIRPVRRDVAVVDGRSTVTFGDGTAAASRFSAVMVRQGGRWLLDAVRENAVPPSPGGAGRPLDQLAWLVGSWAGVGPGPTATTRCFWSAGDAFLVRTHAVAPAAADRDAEVEAGRDIPRLLPASGPAEREVTEIIGWDPDSQVIRSWVFTSAGRFAQGTWLRDGDRWVVRLEGRGADTGRSAECAIERRGADEVSVSGPRDGLAADLVPVSDFVRLAR